MPRIPALLPLLAILPAGLAAQEPHILPDARLPEPGEVWIEVSPALLDWSERFAVDGAREPLASDSEGPILSRLFPSITDELVAELNAGAGDLGYDPLGPADVSVGALDFGTVHVQVRRALASVRVGILDRLAIELGAPVVYTEVEPFFAFDSAAATVARVAVALPDGEAFLAGMDQALGALQARVDGGMLAPEERSAAEALLETSSAFVEALRARLQADSFLPLAGTLAGARMITRFVSLSDGFAGFAIELPTFGLRATPGAADLQAFFTGAPLNGALPGPVERSFDVGEVEAGAVVGLLDTSGDAGRSLRLRTSAGAKVRVPIKSADAPPFADRTRPFGEPIGDGQRDLELSLYQDLWLGSRLRVAAAGRVGIQAADRLRVRVHPPDRPFAAPETDAAVRRDLGDYVQLRLAPHYALDDAISVGLEYGYWRKGADAYELLEDVAGIADAGPLEIGTRETRHRVGFGVFYRPGGSGRGGASGGDGGGDRGDGADGERAGGDRPGAAHEGGGADAAAEREASPWRIGIVVQWAVAGSGGRTPASRLLTATWRIPFRPF